MTTKHTPGPWTFSAESVDPEWAISDLLEALAAIVEAGRMSDEPRARYCAEIASSAIAKATGQ